MMDSSADISRVVGLIMENPELIEKISSMMKEESDSDAGGDREPPKDEGGLVTASTEAGAPTSAEVKRHNRARLLGAMKPYLNESRVKAIDTMIGIVDALDMMRGR